MTWNDTIKKFEETVLNLASNCSDLHITSNKACFCRLDGVLKPLLPEVDFSSDELNCLLDNLLDEKEKIFFDANNAVDISYTIGEQRLRISVYRQSKQIAMAVRIISNNIRSIDDKEYPHILKQFALKDNGLILITGPSGSGKSTTLAAMLSYRAESQPCHVITLEDPIEYLFESKRSLIHQREYGKDFFSFEEALKNAMRQDPDVIFIGEIRDYQTMQAAFSAAQTGHLVLSTLHTASAVESLIRIEGLFKKQQQDAIRLELSLILRGIITQKLLPQRNGGRVCAMEILTATDAVRSLIAAGQPQQIMSVIQTSKKDGMQTMEMSLSKLRQEKIIY